MNPVVHFEMPYEDQGRMVEFYSKTFGWKPNILGPEMGNYVVVETGERDEVTKMPKKPGMINGGLYQKTGDNPFPSVVIAVDDIAEAMKNIEMAGGKIIGHPVDIPGTGTYVSFTDTEGNRASIIKPLPM
ncbi:MAG TPA: VOC family protein [Candidatus Paceibacterota bacterium]|nr:VOC family protein [Candidatus Paceibacterota bacterium]